MLFHQLFDRESCTYTYLLADEKTLEAVIIDPVIELNDRDLSLIKELNLKVKYILETHVHADHITGVKKIKNITGAQFTLSKTSNHKQADILLNDEDVLQFGKHKIQTLFTPGHTESCVTYACENKLFTGDALFIRGCGRTDFQGGSSENLFNSVHKRIYSYPDSTWIYPGHDYKGRTVSTVGEEKRFNPRLKITNSLQDFSNIMNSLNLPYPRLIDKAVPKNLNCLD